MCLRLVYHSWSLTDERIEWENGLMLWTNEAVGARQAGLFLSEVLYIWYRKQLSVRSQSTRLVVRAALLGPNMKKQLVRLVYPATAQYS